MSELSKRITQAIYAELRRQADTGGYGGPSVNPAIGVDEFDGIAHIEGEVDLAATADAVARDLKFQEEWTCLGDPLRKLADELETLNVTRLENGLDPGRMAWSPADLRAEANRLDVSDRDEWRSRLTLGQMGE